MDDASIRARFYDLRRLLGLRAALRRVAEAGTPRAELVAGGASARAALSDDASPMPRRRVGVLPGSFNPPTLAHTALAAAGLAGGSLDVALYALSTSIVGKEIVTGAALEDRLLLLEVACERDPRLGVLLLNGGLYVEHAELVHAHFPGSEVVFLVGFDKIVQIFDPRYYADRDAALERLFALATFLVAPRGSDGVDELGAVLGRPENRRFARAVGPLALPPRLHEVASSRVRRDVASGAPPLDELPSESRVFVEECRPFDGSATMETGADRYSLRLALLGQLEAADRDADFRAVFARAVADQGDPLP